MTGDLPIDELRRIASRQRAYASLREGGTKGEKELGVLNDLLASMESLGQRRYVDPALPTADPPDCTARTVSGQLVAVEVTEFVSQDAIEVNERTRRQLERRPGITEMVMREWSGPEFLEHLNDILARKDTRTFKEGPYAETVVVIHTDEPLLTRHQCEQWLVGHSFGPFKTLTHGYFLYPYEPPSGYPFRHLFGAA